MVEYFKAVVHEIGGRVYAANSSPHSTGLLAADTGILVPPLSDPEYIDVLLDICARYEITGVVSLFDLELPLLAAAKARFATVVCCCCVGRASSAKIRN